MEMESIFWLALFVILVLIEIATMGLTTIWFAGGAIAGFIASLLNAGLMVQVVAFVVVSILLLVFTRPFAVKYVNKTRTRTNADSLIGEQAIVTQDIDNLMGAGTANVKGQEWTARAQNEHIKIKKGTQVTILQISGVKLIVKESER